jgi:cephalosporin-C deacetylase-like acetyl esterase
MERRDVTFDSSGQRCAAWLYTPDTPAPRPCVVMAHGFGGVRQARLDAFAERFAAAGISALLFDYRHFGASGGEPRQDLDVPRQLDDWRSAIEFARSLDDVDPERVAAWGTSFSGGHVATIAAEDHRLAAAVSQGPMMSGLWALRAAGPRNMAKLTVAGLRDEWARLRRRPRYMIGTVGPPGSLSAMNSPDAEPGYRALFKDQSEFRNEVTARFGLSLGLYRPVRKASRIACPWLVCICERDVVTPPQPAFAAAKRAPRSEVRTYDVGHFDIYVGDTFEQAVKDQVAFLERHLLAGTPAKHEAALR